MPKRQPARPQGGTDTPSPPDAGIVEFSTAQWPEHLRLFAVNEFCANFIKSDIAALPDQPFHLEGKIRRLPGLGIAWAAGSGLRASRSARHVANDDVMVTFNLNGERLFKDETRLRAGQGRVVLEAGPGGATIVAPTRHVSLTVPRRALAPRVLTAKSSVIPARNDALQLLRCYLGNLEHAPPATAAVQKLAVAHVYDIVTMLLGATGDDAALARGRGVRAARIMAIKNDIAARLTEPDLSVATVAQRNRISARYLHRLFEEDGTTFSTFVLELRLARAERLLTDARHAQQSISTIGYDVGFGDLSYFYRSFRRRFGATPSDVRAAARQRSA
jgi:AraC-like DNA-binding protein